MLGFVCTAYCFVFFSRMHIQSSSACNFLTNRCIKYMFPDPNNLIVNGLNGWREEPVGWKGGKGHRSWWLKIRENRIQKVVHELRLHICKGKSLHLRTERTGESCLGCYTKKMHHNPRLSWLCQTLGFRETIYDTITIRLRQKAYPVIANSCPISSSGRYLLKLLGNRFYFVKVFSETCRKS